MRRRGRRAKGRAFVVSAGTLAIIMVAGGISDATPLALNPALDLQGQGLSVAEAGVGLQNLGSGTATLTVGIGGPVQKAFLYWAGRELAGCPQGSCFDPPNVPPFGDQKLKFDGTPITGTIVGREDDVNSNIAYRADVTSIVSAKGTGNKSFSIKDGDVADNLDSLNGAGLLVLYTDPAETNFFRVIVAEGLDFAWGDAPVPPFKPENVGTVPADFNYGAVPTSRTARLVVFAGDCQSTRPDRIDISDNASQVNQLNSSDGNQWDTDAFDITIPAGETTTRVQAFSAPIGSNPDSLLWVVAALRIPIPAPGEGCTPGFWKNHPAAWGSTGFSPGQTLSSVFVIPGNLSSLAPVTLHNALKFSGGPGVLGGAKILLRASVAAVLNAAHPGVDYPRTPGQVTSAVNTALASNNRSVMLSLASSLDADNNLGCSLS